MIYCNLLKLSLSCTFYDQKCVQFSLTSFGALRYDCVIKSSEMFGFLPPVRSSVTRDISNLYIKDY